MVIMMMIMIMHDDHGNLDDNKRLTDEHDDDHGDDGADADMK